MNSPEVCLSPQQKCMQDTLKKRKFKHNACINIWNEPHPRKIWLLTFTGMGNFFTALLLGLSRLVLAILVHVELNISKEQAKTWFLVKLCTFLPPPLTNWGGSIWTVYPKKEGVFKKFRPERGGVFKNFHEPIVPLLPGGGHLNNECSLNMTISMEIRLTDSELFQSWFAFTLETENFHEKKQFS